MVECYASKLHLMRIDLYQVINNSLSIVLTLLIKIVNAWIHSRFLPGVFKVPLSPLKDNDIALREDNTPIYGGMLPVKSFPSNSKTSKLLKFTISTKKIDKRECQEKICKVSHSLILKELPVIIS